MRVHLVLKSHVPKQGLSSENGALSGIGISTVCGWGEEISPVGEHLLEDAVSQVEEFGFGERGNGDPEEDSQQRVGLS